MGLSQYIVLLLYTNSWYLVVRWMDAYGWVYTVPALESWRCPGRRGGAEAPPPRPQIHNMRLLSIGEPPPLPAGVYGRFFLRLWVYIERNAAKNSSEDHWGKFWPIMSGCSGTWTNGEWVTGELLMCRFTEMGRAHLSWRGNRRRETQVERGHITIQFRYTVLFMVEFYVVDIQLLVSVT